MNRVHGPAGVIALCASGLLHSQSNTPRWDNKVVAQTLQKISRFLEI
jgi:hypothetical protein